jgi:PAS domain-containing protein
MHDAHRTRHELIHEITGLRKQITDLKEAMTARRRVEDALRDTENTLRRLADSAPVGLGLFDPTGRLIAANRTLAGMLGYDSPADLLAIAAVLGLFATPEEQSLALALAAQNGTRPAPGTASFRLKSGCREPHSVLARRSPDLDHGITSMAVFPTGTPIPSVFRTPLA